MDPLSLLAILSLLSLHSQLAYGDPSVVFLDSPTRQYLRPPSAETATLSLSEVGAAASVLLGFAPPSTLSASSSSKLNEVLVPNPFDRPHSVFMIEVTGVEDSELMVGSDKSAFSSAFRVKFMGSEDRVDIQLSDEHEVSLVSLNERSSYAEYSDKELSDFASWLGGSYVEDATGPLIGELIVPMATGAVLRLRMSEKADREFTTSLVFLINNIQRAMEMHKGLSESGHSPAELITGRFDGIKALQDHYGTEGISQNGLELFVTSVLKIYDSLQAAYKGQLVGVIVCGGPHSPALENMLNVMVASRPSARWLEENKASTAITKLAEVALVRKTLAWITGIILLISTILGIYFLLNMPLTKDTLLYSNVKLD
ncbi:putative type 1 membrane protein [Abeliophyllum distichum]|uniref:Type 1 membrane protein n=1 Tax=Abeliophyllum distichum TaxID=126358 RepID=A0ABD1Q000_9LAMI